MARTATAPRAASPAPASNAPAFSVAPRSRPAAPAAKPEKTILGVKLRSICRATVNSYARGRKIPVQFRGRGAWTDNEIVNLPRVMDLAEIPWSVAKAYTGYAIHEVAHIRETDFNEVRRSYAEGKLVQAFANGIEDYRIERNTSRMFKGAALDLAAMRVHIHPALTELTPQWLADPRKCGAIALTWTGANLNGFANPFFDDTMDAFPPPVRVMIDRWTAEMEDVRSTKEVVDLAIRFAEEAEKYAAALMSAASTDPSDSDDAGDTGDCGDQGGQGSSGGDDQGGQGTRSSGKSAGKPSGDDQGGASGSNDNDNADGQDGDADGSQAGDDDGTNIQADGGDADDGDSGNDTDDTDDGDPFKSMIDPMADIDDLLDALADQIADSAAQTGAPDDDADPTDGEVNPAKIEDQVDAANSVAPQYDSEEARGHDNAGSDDDSPSGQGAMRASYNDKRIAPVEITGDGSVLQDLTANAAGVISTTARTIRRLLVAADKSGTLTNRRSGTFDIRNISGIVRETGTVYKKTWERPGETTLLATLVDMSGSMGGDRLSLAMTGGLAIAQAVANTRIEHWMYGFAGCSPNVLIHEFAGPASRTRDLRRRIDSYESVSLGCTPTGEAIAAIGTMMDEADADRRVLLVLTDGDADDECVARSATNILLKRGIEVVAIGIQSPSVTRWAPVAHQIDDIAGLPAALLATIDPRKRHTNTL